MLENNNTDPWREEIEKQLKGFAEGAKHREEAIAKLTKATFWLGLLMVVVILFGGFYTLRQLNVNHDIAHKAVRAAHTAGKAIDKVAESRKNSIFTSCKSQDQNHDNTIKQLKKSFGKGDPAAKQLSLGIHYLLKVTEDSPAAKLDPTDTQLETEHFLNFISLQQQEIKASLNGTIFLIDKLQPSRPCKKVVKKATTS